MVSILVILDVALEHTSARDCDSHNVVSILVILDVALERDASEVAANPDDVSILVILDVALEPYRGAGSRHRHSAFQSCYPGCCP